MTQTGSEIYFRQLCEHLGISVVATDADLKIRIWNHAASRMFGAASEQMQGVSVATIFPQEVREQAIGLLRRAFETGEIISFEFQHADTRGERRELISTFAAVVSDSGARIGASACIRDITQRIVLQSELDESRKMAALGTLAGGIAHHFNNILGGIITSVDFAGTSDDVGTMARVLRQTGQALARASRLVNGLLAFSQGDQHADDLSDFTEIIFTLIDGFEAEAKEQGVDLQVNFPKLPVLSVAGTQVMTILRNITRNALEAMPNGGTLRIDVSLDADWIVTEISDTGCGLDEAAQARIFEPFWSTKASGIAGPGEAVGLGLAITHGLVQVLGGAISVSSAPNQGSCFRVTIPRPGAT